MCGRFSQDATWAEVWAFTSPLSWEIPQADLLPAYNIAPTQTVWSIRARQDGNEACQMRWGLAAAWSKASLINARLETVATTACFRQAWRERRCIIPASGWFEWRKDGPRKQPVWIHPAQGRLLLFAGIWQPEVSAANAGCFAILTCEAEGELRSIHSRRPVLLGSPWLQHWLHGSASDAAAIAGGEPPALHWHPVSAAVGNVRNHGPALIEAWHPASNW